MRAVYKYPLPVKDSFLVEMPAGAQILSVQAQGETPTLWALVDPRERLETVTILCCGTGHDRSDLRDARFIGTVQLLGGAFVLHFFEAKRGGG